MTCGYCDPPPSVEHTPGCPIIGVKAGGGDDAIHLVWTKGSIATLCKQDASTRNTALSSEAATIDGMAGCWTCLIIASERLAP